MIVIKLLPGLGVAGLLALAASLASLLTPMSRSGVSPLTLAMAAGCLVGNLWPSVSRGTCVPGLRFAQKNLLRVGIALFGFNLNLFQISEVGRSGLLIDVLILLSTMVLGYLVGTRCLKMEGKLALLISAGNAICGAAAIAATVSVLEMSESERVKKAATAVATVVMFGTLAIFLYPLLFSWSGANRLSFGVFVGSTVHEVAQVVAIGNVIGEDTARSAVITKMIRVLLLIPFLLGLSFWTSHRRGHGARKSISVPWFAVLFALCAAANSLLALPEGLVLAFRQAASISLTFAMAAFGVETTIVLMRQAGLKPLLLGAVLFIYLVTIGGSINLGLQS